MSVRRLAAQQPDSFAFSKETMEEVRWWIAKYPPERKASAVIPIMWLAQKQEGWVSEPAIRAIAELLSMPTIRVLEVATFYTMFLLAPVGSKAHVQLCGTTPCWLRGSSEIVKACEKAANCHVGETSADMMFTISEVECLGACVNAPMVQINDEYYEDLTPQRMTEIMEALRAGKDVPKGPQTGRRASMSQAGTTILVTTHYLDEAEHCHRIAIIQGGTLAALGTATELKDVFSSRPIVEIQAAQPVAAMEALDRSPAIEKTSLFGTAVHAVLHATDDAEGVAASVLADAGVEVHAVSRVSPSLEDVFLDVVERTVATP